MKQCCYLYWQNWLMLVGRIFISLIFVVSGILKIINFRQTAGLMSQAGIHASHVFLIIAIIFELGGGLLVLFGWYTRFGAFLLFLFIIPVTYVFHSFWTFTGAQSTVQFQQFFKNLTIWGTMIYLMAVGAGHYSIDGFFRRVCCKKNNARSID